MVNFSFQWHLRLFIICSVYEKDHMSELRTKNRSERDLLSCEVTSQLRRSLSLLLFIILLLQLPAPQQSAGRDWGTFSLLSPSRYRLVKASCLRQCYYDQNTINIVHYQL